jgi:tRNA-specific 2-thiouridylase
MPPKQVAVAMSGGIDSSVAAALLKNQGYKVFGITMKLYSRRGENPAGLAKQVAESLGIPHYAIDLRRPFQRQVIKPFCTEYGQGRTPNPCIACNQYIKLGLLLDKALNMGADYLATGHYVRIEPDPSGYRLLKGIDPGKDQSYFLYTLGQEQLRYLLMPMGSFYKNQTRRMARELGLPNTTKHESQDICFIPDNDYHSFIAKHIPSKPGDIIDTDGIVLGRHKGLAHYTVGQRQGIGLASDKRLYVLKLDAINNRLVVGRQSQLLSNRLVASRLSWVSGKSPQDGDSITARVRYKSTGADASLHFNNDTAEVRFSQPQRAISPGQSVVFYQGEAVSGGGIIESSELSQGGEPDKKSS